MTERAPRESDDFLDQPGPGSDPGDAYRRAADDAPVPPEDEEADAPDVAEGPGVGDVYRSGS